MKNVKFDFLDAIVGVKNVKIDVFDVKFDVMLCQIWRKERHRWRKQRQIWRQERHRWRLAL